MSQDVRIAFRGLFALLPLLVSFTFTFPAGAAPAGAAPDARVSATYGRLPLHFEANRGQTHKDVRFVARGPNYGLYLTAGEMVLVLARPSQNARAEAKPVALHMSLVGAACKPLASGREELVELRSASSPGCERPCLDTGESCRAQGAAHVAVHRVLSFRLRTVRRIH